MARKPGISAMTVSRALDGKPDISEQTRKAVMRCAEAMGYRPNRWARSLVTQRSNLIGVVLPEIAHSFFADLIAGVEEVLDGAGYDLLLCHSRGRAEREADEVKTLVACVPPDWTRGRIGFCARPSTLKRGVSVRTKFSIAGLLPRRFLRPMTHWRSGQFMLAANAGSM